MYNHSRAKIRLLTISLLLLACRISLPAQIDTTLKRFFPMRMGNYWEYKDSDFPPGSHRYIKITGDTLMPNGKTYRIFKQVRFGLHDTTYRFYRVDDSLRVWRYYPVPSACVTGEYPIYDLSVRDRSIWPVCFDLIPSSEQEYNGLYGTQLDYFDRLQLFAVSKFFVAPVTVNPTSRDTSWFNAFTTRWWLADSLGLARLQGEAGPVDHLVGAIINGVRYGTITSLDDQGQRKAIPAEFNLHQNFPNPFNPSTAIQYEVAHGAYVDIRVYNVLGQEIEILIQQRHEPGRYTVKFNASGFAAGVYLYRMRANETIFTRTMVLIK